MSGPQDLATHTHVHVPGEPGNRTTLVLLHGTGGDERQLLELGRLVAPGAGLLGIKGNVLEAGQITRWFRRLREGVFDTDDVVRRADELAAFLDAAVEAYDLDPDGLVAVGFSNGANIGAAVALRRPGLLRGAALVSSMLPFEPDAPVELSTTGVLLVQGRVDPFAPAPSAEALARLLSDSGAAVEVRWHDDGHALGQRQAVEVQRWLTGFLVGTGAPPGATPPR